MNSHTTAPSNAPLLDETIGANFEKIVTRFGDREALIDVPTGDTWTYSELDRDVDRVATSLLGIGLDKGDRIGMWALNC
ncbi:MAG: AMP-binding protein, partial [Propionibacteriales bacterium]|nr:AMP-binding protein [Propionibacteriales bacterium]